MRSYIRKPSVKKSISARTTGRVRRSVNKAVNPLYGRKGIGYIKNPKRAIYNKVYYKTSKGMYEILGNSASNYHLSSKGYSKISSLANQAEKSANKSSLLLGIGTICLMLGFSLVLFVLWLGILFLIIAIVLFVASGINKIEKKDLEDEINWELNREENYCESELYEKNNKNIKQKEAALTRAKLNFDKLIIGKNQNNNMNCKIYRFSGRYIDTGCIRRNRKVYAFDDQEVKAVISAEGYAEPIEYVEDEFPVPSEDQLLYLNKANVGEQPMKLCKQDVEGILTMYETEDVLADQSLYRYATEKHVPISYYTPRGWLYSKLYDSLSPRDKRAFIAFSVHRIIANESNESISESKYKDIFYEFADAMESNASFIKSMKDNVDGRKLLHLGSGTENGKYFTGLSKNSTVYKQTIDFLKSKNLI